MIPGPTLLDAPGRIPGVDLARALAVFGMFAAHLLVIDPFRWGDPATWIDVANGRSSILFATLAGVSIALVTGGPRVVNRQKLRIARWRLVVRAGVLWLLGVILIATGVPVYVILPAYALLFLLALPLLRMPVAVLWALAAALAVVIPFVMPLLNALPMWQGVDGHDLGLALGWHYPAPLWLAFLVAGLAAGRSDLRSVRTLWSLVVGGVIAAVAAFAASALLPAGNGVLSIDAHSGGLLEVVGSGGFALATIGACVLVCRVAPVSRVVLPLRAVGSMPLTAYVGQLVAWVIIAVPALGETGDLAGFRELQPFWPFVIGTLVFCTAWALLLGRGPLERGMDAVARRLVPGVDRLVR